MQSTPKHIPRQSGNFLDKLAMLFDQIFRKIYLHMLQ